MARVKLPAMRKIQTREISAFCPSFDKAPVKSMEPLE